MQLESFIPSFFFFLSVMMTSKRNAFEHITLTFILNEISILLQIPFHLQYIDVHTHPKKKITLDSHFVV